MAIGDNNNNVSMLSFADLSVAIANGSKAAKQAADFVTKSNVADGVAYAISKFCLQNQRLKELKTV